MSLASLVGIGAAVLLLTAGASLFWVGAETSAQNPLLAFLGFFLGLAGVMGLVTMAATYGHE